MLDIQYLNSLVNNRFLPWVKKTKSSINGKNVSLLKNQIFKAAFKNQSSPLRNRFFLLTATFGVLGTIGTTFLMSKKLNADPQERVSEEFAQSFWAATKVNTLEKPWSHLDSLKFDQEAKNKDMLSIQNGHLKYYSLSELYNKRVEVRNGLLYPVNGKLPLHSDDILDAFDPAPETQRFNYVMFKDGTLLMDLEKPRWYVIKPLKVNHGSLAAAHEEPVAAGEIIIRNGHVDELNESSDHFKPKYRVQYVEQQLRSMGATFTKDYKIHNYDEITISPSLWSDPEEDDFLEEELKGVQVTHSHGKTRARSVLKGASKLIKVASKSSSKKR